MSLCVREAPSHCHHALPRLFTSVGWQEIGGPHHVSSMQNQREKQRGKPGKDNLICICQPEVFLIEVCALVATSSHVHLQRRHI